MRTSVQQSQPREQSAPISAVAPESRSNPVLRLQSAAGNQAVQRLPFFETIQRSFGRYDISGIRAHTGARAAFEATRIGADAFTRGRDVTFSRAPSLQTAAHEAAHTIQQRAGVSGGSGHEGDLFEQHAEQVAQRVVRGRSSEDLLGSPPDGLPPSTQMRRIPAGVRALMTASSGGAGANSFANRRGLRRLVDRAMAELTAAERTAVMVSARSGLTAAQFGLLSVREQLTRQAEAIVNLFPAHELGDPALIDTGPRAATADAANITTLVTEANKIFDDIAAGTEDTNLTEVFGAGSIAAAKVKYAEAKTWMNNLHALDRILTDRSGYTDEVFQGGLTGFHSEIRVSPGTIDSPADDESIVTMIHESMHAGNLDVDDNGYIDAPQFTTRSEADKLLNAAHFEVVPRRMLGAANSYTGTVFVPAGTTVGSTSAPLPTDAEQGARAASERMRGAWTLGLNLHLPYVQLFKTPSDWTVPQPTYGGMRFDNSLPFWSKVQKLTIHEKSVINPASADPAEHPVSQIDVALSEGMVRKLALGMFMLDPLETEADVLAFEASKSTAAERSAAFPGGVHNDPDKERDFLLKLVLRDAAIAPVTGRLSRDIRVVAKMGDPALALWSDILAPRLPSSFVD